MGIEKIIFIYPTYETTRLTVEDTLQFVPLSGVYARQNYARMPIGDLTRKVADYIRGTGAAHIVLTMDQGSGGGDDLWEGTRCFLGLMAEKGFSRRISIPWR